MKKTAVDYIFHTFYNEDNISDYVLRIFEQAKEMEKNNICDAWDNGYDKGTRDRIEKISNPVGNAEQYYNQTYKSE